MILTTREKKKKEDNQETTNITDKKFKNYVTCKSCSKIYIYFCDCPAAPRTAGVREHIKDQFLQEWEGKRRFSFAKDK